MRILELARTGRPAGVGAMTGHGGDDDELDALLALEDEEEEGDDVAPVVPEEYEPRGEGAGGQSVRRSGIPYSKRKERQHESSTPKAGIRRNGEEVPLILPSPKRARALAPGLATAAGGMRALVCIYICVCVYVNWPSRSDCCPRWRAWE